MRFLITGLVLLIVCSTGNAHQWSGSRLNYEGKASLRYTGSAELNEWHYIYKSNRRYKPGLAVWASPALAVVGGHPMAFIGGYDQTLHALDLAEKSVVWKKITNSEIASAPAIGTVDGTDVVFFGSTDRTVYAHIAFSGRRLWTKELVPPSNTLGEVSMTSPYIADNKLFIGCFVYDKSLARNKQIAYLYCLNISQGLIKYKLPITSGIITDPVCFSIGTRLYAVIAARRGLLQCFDVTDDTPAKMWAYQMPHEVMGSPVISMRTSPPMIFLGSKYGNFVAINALTGKEVWKKMAGNWIDNAACLGDIDGKPVVFVGSYDYFVYAFSAQDGNLIWKKALGGEVFSAPAFFTIDGNPHICVASLDNHIYVLDAKSGEIESSYFTGQPIWDKLPKGETVWGSPTVFEAGNNSAIVYGAFNDMVYTIPLSKQCSLTAMARSVKSLWISLLATFVIFVGIVLPVVLKIPLKTRV